MDVYKSEMRNMTRRTDSDKAREVANANVRYINHHILCQEVHQNGSGCN
jgi:hypothetical protein